MQQSGTRYLTGAICGFAAVSIWAGWSAVTRLAVTTGLDAWDSAALRFGVAGLRFAPAHHQAALNPGFMPIFVAVIAAVFLRERLSRPQKLGLCLIAAAALLIVGWPDADRSTARAWDHALFL